MDANMITGEWRKSRRSSSNGGACVEVTVIANRDT